MKNILIIFFTVFFNLFSHGQVGSNSEKNRVVSKVDSTSNQELVLIQEFIVNSSIDSVWKAYTTKNGWENWAVPLAQIDLKIGGFIKTNYNKAGKIGDSTTIVTHIINYVPKKLITLQAEITDNFPEFMKKEAKDFYNVIYFDETEDGKTMVKSYGIGYKNTPKYLALMDYFIPTSEQLLLNLILYLETDAQTKKE